MLLNDSSERFLHVLNVLLEQCDERVPSCGNCARRSTACSFSTCNDYTSLSRSQDRPVRDESLTRLPSSQASSDTAVTPDSRRMYAGLTATTSLHSRAPSLVDETTAISSTSTSSIPVTFDLYDLELWHRYIKIVSHTLSDGQSYEFWSERIPEIACRSTFVAQLLLVFSALHLARMDPSRKVSATMKSDKLQVAAINSMMDTMSEGLPENAAGFWVAAMLLCFCSFARGPQPGQYLVYSDLAEPEWLGLLQGVKSILKQHPDAIAAAMPELAVDDNGYGHVEPEEIVRGVTQAMQDLHNAVDALEVEDISDDRYSKPVKELETCFAGLYKRRGDGTNQLQSFQIFAWLYRLEQNYLDAIRRKKPMALVIFAHYLILMAQLKNVWYLDGWVSHIMHAIVLQTHPAYQRYLEWPSKCLEV